METFYRITMQPPLFDLKLKTIPLLHRRDHFVFTCKFLQYVQSNFTFMYPQYEVKLVIVNQFVSI